ncbi:Outer membrane protein [Elusimicrobium minutum Pei191]|uniref:Outer membrane protein n=1 Tax=Elusimicrobium minutum (strain Pei191) TaxID=445932 RepID=B2KD91_ELUMP|nr:OmpA family protein [Elusimicrobium minutum]ACC98487.1 Outer membrane protein [Elusimicrobium minutum Pei191]
MKKIVLTVAAGALILAACTTPGKNTGIGAATGAAVGAVGGAVIAHNTGGKAETGAIIGGLAGAALGGGIGNYYDKQAKELAAIATVERNADGSIRVIMKNDILFATGSAELSSQAINDIAAMSKVFKKYPYNIIVVEGHTDSTGSASFNQTLSENRARAVYNQLIANNVKTYSIGYRGYGASNPIASNDTAAGRAQNRRVTLNIKADKKTVEANYKG